MQESPSKHQRYVHHKTDTPPVILSINVDPGIKETIKRCAKTREVSMNKVINEILQKAIPNLEKQIKMFSQPPYLTKRDPQNAGIPRDKQ